ncbi:MAG: hypothetical protein E6R06_16695 [Mycobacterium sp.]|jgi:hypothetical protein|nr:MAG: hypothetical protein E6R06_16695 [Mycobacterium sp.]
MPNLQTECSSCTVPTDRLDGLCSFCADPPPPLDVDALLVEADEHLAEPDPLVYPLAARIAHASAAFPLNGWSCYVTDVDKSRFTITATRRTPETGEIENREFVCAVLEVTR